MKTRTQVILRRTLLALLLGYWGLVIYLTHAPKVPSVGPKVSDKTAHFVAYGTLAGLGYLSLWAFRPRMRWTGVVVLGCALAYGVVDEVTQPLSGRDCELLDWLADAGGAALAVAGLTVARWFMEGRGEPGGELAAAKPAG